MPAVSVIMPAYNAAATIVEALDSVLAQSFRDREIIVVDDASTDATSAILRGYGDRIRVVERPEPQTYRGSGPARNSGCAHAAADYLAFLDADDTWYPEFLARTMTALEREPQAVLAYSNLALVDSAGRLLGAPMLGRRFDHAPTLAELLAEAWPIMPSGVLMRRAAYTAAGGFVDELGTAYDDIYFWLAVRARGPFCYISEQLGTWRFSRFPRGTERPKARGDQPRREIFERLVRENFGVSAAPLVNGRRRAPRSIYGYIGLRALHRGDRATARTAFLQALRIDPLRVRNYLRLVRTFLPARAVAALSGRSRYLPRDI